MIRVLAVVLGLAAGLAAAVLVWGRAGHLAWLDAGPDWVAALDPEARPAGGSARGPGGLRPGWQLTGIDAAGPRWALRLDGPGVALTAEGRAAFGGGGPMLAIDGARGEAVLTGALLSGLFRVEGGGGRLDRAGLTLALHGRGERLGLNGAALPDGPVRFEIGHDGRWRLTLPGPGGAGPAVIEGDDAAALIVP